MYLYTRMYMHVHVHLHIHELDHVLSDTCSKTRVIFPERAVTDEDDTLSRFIPIIMRLNTDMYLLIVNTLST